MGLLGADAGLLWVVGGVWTVRHVWGRPVGLAWGIALFGAGLRWGTLSLGGIQAATRVLGPTLVVGPVPAAAGAAVALAAALLEGVCEDGLRARPVAVRAAAGLSLLALVPAFCVPGAGAPSVLASLGWWAAAGAGLTALVLLGSAMARRVPGWLPPAMAVAGVLMIGSAR